MKSDQTYPDIQIVDENDRVTGQMQWTEAHKVGANMRVAKVFLHDGQGNMLMQQRSQEVTMPGQWCEAAAGHVDAGESYEQAAVRELKEETGIEGVKLKEFDYQKIDYGHLSKFFRSYIGQYNGPIDGFDRREVAKLEWWSIERVLGETTEHPERFTDSFLSTVTKAIEATHTDVNKIQ